MARLPDSSAFGQRSAPRPKTDVTSYDGGDAVARASIEVGQAISQVGEMIEKKNDEQAVFEARRKLDEWERKAIYDPKEGVVAKRGADALNLPQTIPTEFDKFAGEVGNTLGNNRQRKIFQDMAQSRRNQVADFTVRHAVQQKEVYERGQFNADMASSADRAVLLASNGNVNGAKAELDTSGERLVSFMKSRGASGEEVANALKEHTSKTHFMTIAALVNGGKPMDAQKYMEANAGGMRAEEEVRAAGLLKEGTTRAKAQGFADEVMPQGLSMDASLEKARETFKADPLAREAAVHEIKTRFAEKEAVRAQTVKQLSNEGWSVVVDRGTKALPTSLVERLRTEAPEELRQMRDWEQAKWRQAKADAEGRELDPSIYYGLRMMAAENPEEFGKLNLLKSQPQMSKQHYNHLVELQASISNGDLKAMESQRVMKSTFDMIKNEAGAAGIDLKLDEKDKGTKKAQRTLAFMGSLTQALDEATASKGKALTPEEAKRIGMGLLREGVVQGSGIFFDDKKRGFELTPEERAKFASVPYDKIPAADRAEIETSLYPNGKPSRGLSVDKSRVERIYQRALDAGVVR